LIDEMYAETVLATN